MDKLQLYGIFLLRIVVGFVFAMHGGQKLFSQGIGTVAKSFHQMGIPHPELFAVVVALAEFLGGLALILGFLTRFAAFALAVDMAVAVVQVHWRNGFFLPAGFEYALTLFAANLALLLTGAGALSVDSRLFQRKKRGR
ncbi:MAG: DoxX family protein [Acidobacteriota bacterium]|nr:DoxX family protein [Acidobacteriota bacterium]